MHAVDFGDGEALHHALLDHLAAAAAAFLRRLEDHRDRTLEVARFGEILCRPEQHGRMAVMAAGMHLAGVFRCIGLAGDFIEGERIHVGSQANRLSFAVASANDADDAGPADAGGNLVDAEAPQLVRDKCRGLVDIEHQFRILVQMAAPPGDFFLHFDGAIKQGHSVETPNVRTTSDNSVNSSKVFCLLPAT